MTRWIERASMTLLVVACLLLVFAILRTIHDRRRGQSLCPGPRLSLRDFILPWLWFTARCWYDLRGIPSNSDHTTTCPECGTRSTPVRFHRSRHRRLFLLAALLILTASAGLCLRTVRRAWPHYAPTPLLTIAVDRLRGLAPSGVRSELSDRLAQSQVSAPHLNSIAAAAIANLGDDDVPDNAQWAISTLQEIGDAALPLLEQALDSPDYQRRQLAAAILQWRCRRHTSYAEDGPIRPYAASPALFRVSVEGLADDTLPLDRSRAQSRYTWISNAYDGLVFLAESGPAACPYLQPALHSTDPQQQALAAIIAGLIGDPSLLEEAVPILTRQLRKNTVEGDAAAASRALFNFGPRVLPYVRPLVASPDKQQSDLARLLIMNFETPGQPIEIRRKLNNVTRLVADPTTDLSVFDIRCMLD